jgi:glutamate synthase (ferredoxin)
VAEEVRQGLASLGLRSMDELVGRLDYLKPRGDLELAKTSSLDLSFLTTYVGPCEPSSTRIAAAVHDNGPQLDDEVLADADVMAAIESGGSVSKSYSCVNTDRSCLARVAGQIAKRYGDDGFPVRSCPPLPPPSNNNYIGYLLVSKIYPRVGVIYV